MKVCRLSKEDLVEVDMIVKREPRERNMHGGKQVMKGYTWLVLVVEDR